MPPCKTKQETVSSSSEAPICRTAPTDRSYLVSTDASPLTALMCQDHGRFTILHTSHALKGVMPYDDQTHWAIARINLHRSLGEHDSPGATPVFQEGQRGHTSLSGGSPPNMWAFEYQLRCPDLWDLNTKITLPRHMGLTYSIPCTTPW